MNENAQAQYWPWRERAVGSLTETAQRKADRACKKRVCAHEDYFDHYVTHDPESDCWVVRGTELPVWCLTLVHQDSWPAWVEAARDNWPYLSKARVEAALVFAVLHRDQIQDDMDKEHNVLQDIDDIANRGELHASR